MCAGELSLDQVTAVRAGAGKLVAYRGGSLLPGCCPEQGVCVIKTSADEEMLR
jgi:hypothetical protein